MGFTLIELIAVLLLIGIVSATVTSRFFSATDAALLGSRDDVVSALRLAQQTAMDQAGSVTFVATSTSISVNINGAPASSSAFNFPLSLRQGVSLSPAVTLNFNRLGETSATTLALTAGSETINVTVSAAGYAR
ncbi:type II secretion system protein [Simiduia aestuariiviva]|uniref:MSHA pilin protein MshC n=1 Tax=Simiduia aestuariiviva TaxID=1510459 RepID=A0A839UTQ0_9GAMM|nr:type II secretion system protein [Simiduia aestuariiviva]MBB3168757.1 MSHA pilin protein MshC [Simiduia aestuariiviva]